VLRLVVGIEIAEELPKLLIGCLATGPAVNTDG